MEGDIKALVDAVLVDLSKDVVGQMINGPDCAAWRFAFEDEIVVTPIPHTDFYRPT